MEVSSDDRNAAVLNLLEPTSLIRHFEEQPPEGFSVWRLPCGVPAFSTVFDLLTTMEPATVRKLDALPFSRWWRRFLRPRSCFIGTTVSEYALLSDVVAAETFVHDLVTSMTPRFPFVIIKDLPTEATLVGDAAFAYSRRIAAECSASGFVLMEGQALAYVPIDFNSIDEFLARFSRVRRKNLHR